MSDFIPMISSSPPPLDDTSPCDDWGNNDDDDDFGGFATAHVPVKTQSNEKLELSSNQGMSDAINTNHADDLATSKLPDCDTGFVDKHDGNILNSLSEIPPSADSDGFGHFATTIPPDSIGPFSDSSTIETVLTKTVDPRQRDDENVAQHNICQSDITQQDIAKSIRTCQDDCCSAQSRQCSQDKVSRDSGICSSEISPVTKSDGYQEFAQSEDDMDQFGALQSNDGSALAVDTTDVTVAAVEDVADNGFGSGTTTPSIEPQVETDYEPVNAHHSECVPLSDCGKGAICGDNSVESNTTYQDVSAQIRGETVISESDQSEVKGTAENDCSRETKEHSSNLECGDSATVAESSLKVDVNCACENRTDRVMTERILESNSEFCSGDSALAESTSPQHPESGNESETDSVKQSIENANSEHTNTFQEISMPCVDTVEEETRSVNSHHDINATEDGTKANCDENGRDRLHDATGVTQSECLGNGGETAVISDDGSFCCFVDPVNVSTKTPPESDGQKDQPSCIPPDNEDDDFSNFSTAAEMQNDDTEGDNQQEQPSRVPQDDEDDGLDNFGTAADGQNDENEFDAFSGFKDSGTPSGESNWAAFHSGDLPRAMEDDSGDNWAAFHGSGHQTRMASAGGDKEDDFGDFEEAEFGSFAQKQPSTVSAKPVTVDMRARMETILVQCFPPLQGRVDTDDVSPCLLVEVVMTELRRPVPEQRPAAGRHKAPPTGTVDLNVWNRLKDIEETAALKYTWTASATSRQLLAAIAVDPRNMLLPHKKQSMPAFAADLGLLEPSRGSHREPTKSYNSVIIDTSKSSPPTATDPPPDIPPAEFDWNSSGLTNPLDALQKEQEILEAIETISPSSAVKTLEPLESVLANMKFVSTAPSSMTTSKHNSSNLTEDATRVIQRLPDLSFMHATVLMFPIKGDQ